MTAEGIEAVFLTTHNWGRAVKFFQALGYDLEFATDHISGQLRNGSGPYVFIAEVPESQEPGMQARPGVLPGGRDAEVAGGTPVRPGRVTPRGPR